MGNRVLFVLVTWAAACVVMISLFLVAGSWLDTLNLVTHTAVIAFWMVVWMTQVIIPIIHRFLPHPPTQQPTPSS